MVDTSVILCGATLKNPVIPASGTFGFGCEFNEFYDINCLGGIAVKGTTREKRFGNPTPRIAECCEGLINSVGLQNPGINAVVEHELPALRSVYNGVIISNISGFSVDEYEYCVSLVDKSPDADIIEVNISCPNVHGGGMSFGTNASAAAQVTKAVRAKTSKPLFIKLSPNVTDITEIARACEAEGADGISLINTLMGMRISLKTRKPVIANKKGGFSGKAIMPVAVRMVYEVYEAVNLPIIGMGGVSCAEDVLEFMLAGASAVQVGAANLVEPFACRDIVNDLPAAMERYGINKLSEITGGAHNG